MIRTDIETIIMAAGSVPSIIVLRERRGEAPSDAPLRALSIQTGSFEAAAISRGIEGQGTSRPITHDLFISALQALEAKVERVEINRVDGAVFYATVVLAVQRDQETEERSLDARPSDALSLAVRTNAPIYVDEDIMNRAGTISYSHDGSADEEIEQFDRFVQNLSPDDF